MILLRFKVEIPKIIMIFAEEENHIWVVVRKTFAAKVKVESRPPQEISISFENSWPDEFNAVNIFPIVITDHRNGIQ